MRYIIFILLIIAIVFIYFYYNKKIELLKKQLLITTNQYSIIKNKYGNHKKDSESLLVKFSIPKYKGGTLKANSILYIAPITSSSILSRIDNDTEIAILDCAEFNNETWFYINIPIKGNINNRGWVNSKDISIFFSSSSSIYKAN